MVSIVCQCRLTGVAGCSVHNLNYFSQVMISKVQISPDKYDESGSG